MREDLFLYLNEKEKGIFIDFFPKKSYSKDQVIFSEGDLADFAVLVLEGEIILKKKTEFREKAFILSILRSGAFLGENFLLQNTNTRNVSAVANSNTQVLYITKERWDAFSHENPGITQKLLVSIIHSLSRRLSSMNKRLGALF